MSQLIDGFGFSSYRSFGDDTQIIGPCSKINLLIGQNNSGKSNILLFINKYFNRVMECLINKDRITFEEIEKHKGLINNNIYFQIGVDPNSEHIKKISDNLEIHGLKYKGLFHKLLEFDKIRKNSNLIWIQYIAIGGNKFEIDKKWIEEIEIDLLFSPTEWQQLWVVWLQRGGGNLSNWIPEILENLALAALYNRDISLIPAFRNVKHKDENGNSDNSGAGIIERLAQYQHPDLRHLAQKEDFETINKFLQEVTSNDTARLEIPHNQENILVHMDGKTLPLSYLGTGIHELIILAAEATLRKNCVICIEEPELHMHPLLQKRLLRYLQTKTDNQYFISTHSAHILDTPLASIFHVTLEDGSSQVNFVNNYIGKFSICNDLGYKASDLLQTNCIIWVEGPSDRIYLNHWIKSIDSELVEGFHYSIMFYGGRLLSHLSAHDSEVEEFIALRKINMNLSIVIDSDKSDKSKSINETKKRIRSEFDFGPGFAWITSGREIENYINPELLKSSIRRVHPSAILPTIENQYTDSLYLNNKKGDVVQPDKIKIAHYVVENPANLEILDLQKQINKLVEFIIKSNS